MLKKEIYIVSGPIHSGKSTALAQWCEGKADVYGILSPRIADKRYFIDISTGDQFPMEAEEGEKKIIKIGKYVFSLCSFSKAVTILTNALKQYRGCLVIDEIGPLELEGKGFDEILREILQSDENQLKLILVVRDTIREKVISHYRLNEHLLKDVNFASGKDALV
jgi:nucleoside-triphosphatase THEP1